MREIILHTRLFPVAPEGDLDRNNGMPGAAAAAWARAAVLSAGLPCREVFQEDYGWGFWLDDPTTVWIAVGCAESEAESDDPPEWHVMISHERPIFAPAQWLRGAQGAALVARVAAAIEGAAAAEPAIRVENGDSGDPDP